MVHSPALPTDTTIVAAVATDRFGGARTDVTMGFSSSDTTIATVDANGIVRAKKPGVVNIKVSTCGESATTSVTIVASVARVTVTPASDTVIAGDSATYTARAFGADNSVVTGTKFTFTASPSSTAIVHQTSDSTATIVGGGPGTGTVTATAEGQSANSTVLVLARVFLAGSASANAIDVGDALGCGIITLGHSYCWGLNNHGQVGAKTTSTCFPGTDAGAATDTTVKTTALPCSLVPLRISQDVDFNTISAGDSSSCGISLGGRLYCWGFNFHGEVGNGLTAAQQSPVLALTGLTFTTVSVGGGHACGLATGGTAYCWGDDTYGQLGDARTVNSTTPIPVSGGGAPANFASISAGYRHSCGVLANGTGFCWGNNDFGQLGNGAVGGFSDTPVLIAGFTFQSISAGGDHSCGILTSGGIVCWGSNIDGQLGNGSVGGLSATPVSIAGGGSFTRISASTGTRTSTPNGPAKPFGHGHTCALTTTGTVLCWGDDTDLQLGRGLFSGTGTSSGTPQPVFQGERPGGVTFTSISTGSRHSCGVGSDGNAYCWGSNVMGGLGNTLQAAFRGQPQKVATPN